MEYNNDKKFAGWIRTSQAGNMYINGLFELDGKKYQLNIMKQLKKKSEKAPDYWGTIEEAIKPEAKDDNCDDDAPF